MSRSGARVVTRDAKGREVFERGGSDFEFVFDQEHVLEHLNSLMPVLPVSHREVTGRLVG